MSSLLHITSLLHLSSDMTSPDSFISDGLYLPSSIVSDLSGGEENPKGNRATHPKLVGFQMGEAEVTFSQLPLSPWPLLSHSQPLLYPCPLANEDNASDVVVWVAVWGPQWDPCKATTSFLSGSLFSIQRLSRYFFFYLPFYKYL